MTSKKTTRRALFSSVIALILCCSMLVGTTFAWFTDSVSSLNNVITAGNLDVEVVSENGDITNPDNKLFKDILWEPGVVAYENLTVQNVGTLALKYQMAFNFSGENTVETDGVQYGLSQILKVAVIDGGVNGYDDDAAGRAALLAYINDPANNVRKANLASFSENGKLDTDKDLLDDADQTHTYGIVLYWEPSSEDNNWNVNNNKPTSDNVDYLHIELGVNLFATQVEAEEDSFDETYDKETEVFTVAEVNARLAENKDATLVNCIDSTGEIEAPANYTGTLILKDSIIKSVQAAGDINIVILGNVVVDAKGNGVATMAAAAEEVNGSAISAEGKLTIDGNGHLTAIAADEVGAFGIGGMNATEVTIKNITIDYVSGGYVQQNFVNDLDYGKSEPEGGAAIGSGKTGAVITLSGVTIEEALGGSKAAGIGARYWTAVTVNIENSIINKVVGGNASAGIGGSRVSSDSALNQNLTITIKDSKITAFGGQFAAGIGSGYDTHCAENLTVLPKCHIEITGNSVINATGGKYGAGIGTGYHTAGLSGSIADTVTVNAVNGGHRDKYTAAMNVGFGVIDMSREGTKAADSSFTYNGKTVTVGTAPVVVKPEAISDAITNAVSGDTIVLNSGTYSIPSLSTKEGITIEGAADGSTVVGGENASTGFASNFGKDTTIKNITFRGTSNGVRWSYAQGGDTTFEDCTFAGDSTYGFHIDQSNGATFTFNNCTFIGFNAFAGDLEKVIFNNCTFLSNGNYGHTNIWSVGEFNDCTWGDNTSVSTAGSGKLFFNDVEESYHHEFIGSAQALVDFAKSVNEGGDSWKGQKVLLVDDIDLANIDWEPIGQTGATEFKGIFDGQNHTISNLKVDSSEHTDEHYSSGLFGWAEAGVTIMNVKVDGATVVGNHNVAVIVGYTYSGKVSNCHVTNAEVVGNHANDDACGDKVGLIAGYTADESRFTDCTGSNSTVKGGRDAGQLIGTGYNVSVSGCSATNVTVSATGDCNREGNINNTIIGRVMG